MRDVGERKGPLDLLFSFSHMLLFYPLDLTFLHEGSKTLVDGLVNIEKLVSGLPALTQERGLASLPFSWQPPKDSSLPLWCPACLTDS